MKVELWLPRHPKTRRLAKIWGCHPYLVAGFLLELWAYCLEYQDDGNVDGRPADVLDELAAPCTATSIGTIPTVRAALIDAGFIDGDGYIHDWEDYAGAMLAQRRKDNHRKWLKRHGESEEQLRTSPGRPADSRGTSTPRVEKSRVEKTTSAVGVDARLQYIVACTVACNEGLHANPTIGDHCNELMASSQTAPLDWHAAGIPVDVAAVAIRAAARAYKPKERNPQPRDLRYFDGTVRDAWERVQQKSAPSPALRVHTSGKSAAAPASYEGTPFRKAT